MELICKKCDSTATYKYGYVKDDKDTNVSNVDSIHKKYSL